MSTIARYHRLRDRLLDLQDTHARYASDLSLDITLRLRPRGLGPRGVDPGVEEALARAIQRNIDTLFLSAIRDTERVMHNARRVARDEAQAILDDMTEEDAS